MLVNLHVKNLAIIDEVEVDFSENMNVLTGEPVRESLSLSDRSIWH